MPTGRMNYSPGQQRLVVNKAFAGYASLVILFGDAVAQATSEKKARIESEIMPLFEDLKERDITKAREMQLLDRITHGLLSIMGDSWELSPESSKWIEGLLRR